MSAARERKSSTGRALLLIDVINPFDFDGGEQLLRHALPAARHIAALKAKLRTAGVPAIYVNDNFECWDLGFRELVALQRRSATGAQAVIDLLAPENDDHFVLKPKHSGFYGTSLQLLLEHLGARELILTGFAADICVLFTANDAHMRGYHLVVPSDCVASESRRDAAQALRQMARVLRASVAPSRSAARQSKRPAGIRR